MKLYQHEPLQLFRQVPIAVYEKGCPVEIVPIPGGRSISRSAEGVAGISENLPDGQNPLTGS